MANAASQSRPWRRPRVLIGAVVLVAVAAAAFFIWDGRTGEKPTYRFAKVTRGDIKSVVSASGSLRPVVSVLVGSQVSGKIAELLADFNSPVTAGQVIGRLDPANFEAKVWQAESDLKVAQANVSMQEAALLAARAEVDAARSNLKDSEQDYVRKKELLDRRAVAQSVLDKAVAVKDQARAKLNGALANLRMQEAQVGHAHAMVDEKQAQLKQRELDLSYTIIKSPVDGVVINRSVDVGQTVAASLQAPTLFTIAQDLRDMQVEVSVDEADIGRIREGQDVSFTVDAFPDREFAGKVTQIRKAPTEIQNVVTYTVIVGAKNPDFSLLPGMTANVSMVIGARDDVLKIENTALRFKPADATARSQAEGQQAENRLDQRLERLAKSLSLTEEQQRDIRAIYEKVSEKARSMRAQGVEQDEIRRAVTAMRKNSRLQVEALLDERQRERYREIQQRRKQSQTRRAQVWIVDGAGALTPVDVAIGISDGTVTELVRGDLKEDQRVVIGQTRAAAPSRGLFGF